MDSTFPLENINWDSFFTNEGIVNFEYKKTLLKMGILENDVIILISKQGVRSGAVTFALREMGFTESRNFSGGYDYLTTSMTLEKQINSAFFEKEKKRKSRKKSRSRR